MLECKAISRVEANIGTEEANLLLGCLAPPAQEGDWALHFYEHNNLSVGRRCVRQHDLVENTEASGSGSSEHGPNSQASETWKETSRRAIQTRE